MIRNYSTADRADVLRLWNSAGVKMGYAPLEAGQLDGLLLAHQSFMPELAFVLVENGIVCGFASGCVQQDRGFLSCIILDDPVDTLDNTALLVSALEDGLRTAGAAEDHVSFWCPVRLPWVIPGTGGHQHNNVPGAALDLPLHDRLLSLGYAPVSRECGMYLNLEDFRLPGWVMEKAQRMAKVNYTVAVYDPARHTGLPEMLDALHNPLWRAEIPAAVREGMDVLVGLCDDTVAGFAGPVYPERTGRGYFAGIGVAPRHAHHGLGTLLFYRLCQQEKENGARYMSLFTGEENPAGRIYEGAGFRVVRKFDVMRKVL